MDWIGLHMDGYPLDLIGLDWMALNDWKLKIN
jgi:hypothetical protein